MKKFLLCVLLGIASCGFVQTPDSSSTPSDPGIDKLREGLIESFKKGDIDTLITHLDNNVVVTWQNGEICRGPEAVKAFHLRMLSGEKKVVKEIKAAPEITGRNVYGDWAVSWGNLHDHFVLMDGLDLPFNSAFTATIAKKGDRWLVTAFHTSVSVFDNSVLSLAVRKTGLWAGLGGAGVGLLLGFGAARFLGGKPAVSEFVSSRPA